MTFQSVIQGTVTAVRSATLLAAALSSLACGRSNAARFDGTWIDKATESKIVVVQRSGTDYFVTAGGAKLPAKAAGSQLVVDNQRTLALDEASKTMVFLGDDYVPMDGNQFLGKWAYRNGYDVMEISKKPDGFNVLWRSRADLYQPHEVSCQLVDGTLVGSYRGQNNFQLRVAGSRVVSLTIDPFGEFEAIRNQNFAPTQSVFVVSGGDDFVGYWKHNWDLPGGGQGEVSVSVTKVGAGYEAKLFLAPYARWRWPADFRNGALIAQESVEGQRPALKLVTADSILLTNFYMMGSDEQAMKLVSKTPASSDDTTTIPSPKAAASKRR